MILYWLADIDSETALLIKGIFKQDSYFKKAQ